MIIERDYVEEIREGFRGKDPKKIEKAVNDFYESRLDGPHNEEDLIELFEKGFEIAHIICYKYAQNYELIKNIKYNIELLHEDIIEHIALINFDLTRQQIDDGILKKVSENDERESVEENILTIMTEVAEAYFYREWGEENENKIITPQMYNCINERIVDFSNLIMLGFDYTNRKRKTSIKPNNEELREKYKLFIGNKLQKRDPVRLEKYMKIAKLLKIMDDNFRYVAGSQKIACEIADCEPTSFSKWKNSRRENFDTILKWQEDINVKERTELKNEIDNHIKSRR